MSLGLFCRPDPKGMSGQRQRTGLDDGEGHRDVPYGTYHTVRRTKSFTLTVICKESHRNYRGTVGSLWNNLILDS